MTRLGVLAVLLVLVAGAFTVPFEPSDAGDYGNATCANYRCGDAAPAINALQRGHVGEFFDKQPAMGSFSLVLRAPAAAVARGLGGDESAQYRAGAFLCMLAAVALALAVARVGSLRGMPAVAVLALAALVVINPANGDALQRGHPEEILAAAMLAGAALIAGGRPVFAGVLLGLAMATKQWALLGLFPVAFLAAEGQRLRLIATGIGVAVLFALPMAVGNTHAFREATRAAANPPGTAKPFDVWFPLANHETLTSRLPDGSIGIGKVWTLPRTLDRGAHWLVIALCAGLILAWWLRRARSGPAILLLALVLLLRVVLDPRAHPYHLTPFVLVLAVVEVTLIARVPWRMFTATAVLAVTLRMFDTGLWLTASIVFCAFALPAAVALALGAFRPRERVVAGSSGLAAARPGYG